MKSVVVVVALAAGCKGILGIETGTVSPVDSDVDDALAPIDAPVAMPDGPYCFGSVISVCLDELPQQPRVFTASTVLSTDACAPTGTTPDATTPCIIAGTEISIAQGATVSVTGDRFLILVATESITINGALDASSDVGRHGPGANTGVGCTPPAAASGPSGGAGGSAGSRGGAGGAGGSGSTTPSSSAMPGWHPGCPGGRGGSNGGVGGRGGGAIALIAPVIQVSGSIDVSGEGGSGAATGMRGGGGGGSGGALVLDAPELSVAGVVIAHGGGGGEGSGNLTPGSAGESPDVARPTVPARGGDDTSSIGAAGGDGATSGDGDNGFSGASGAGGGGGGRGWIRSADATPQVSGILSPAPS